MIISVCIPAKNRTPELSRTMKYLIPAANASPPVEIMVLDYNSTDGLPKYIESLKNQKCIFKASLIPENTLSYAKYTGREYYHLAHSFNLAAKASVGEYLVMCGTERNFPLDFFVRVRKAIKKGAIWIRVQHDDWGMLVIQRKEFMDAGGYDERFELYGGEDKDIMARLRRRKVKRKRIYRKRIGRERTPNKKKIMYYNSNMTKHEMIMHNAAIREENTRNNVLVANEGKEWGSWT